MGPRGSADPTHEGRDGLPPVRDFSPGLAASSVISDRVWVGWRSVDGPVIVFPMRDRVGAVERRRCETGSRKKSKILGATVWRMEPSGYPSMGDETVV